MHLPTLNHTNPNHSRQLENFLIIVYCKSSSDYNNKHYSVIHPHSIHPPLLHRPSASAYSQYYL